MLTNLSVLYPSLTVWHLFYSDVAFVKRAIRKSCSYSAMAAIRATTLTATNPRLARCLMVNGSVLTVYAR